MRIFFFRVKQPSRIAAKKRLSAVISSDRVNVSQGRTIERIKGEVASVLSKYASDNGSAGDISVTANPCGECLLTAKIRLKTLQ